MEPLDPELRRIIREGLAQAAPGPGAEGRVLAGLLARLPDGGGGDGDAGGGEVGGGASGASAAGGVKAWWIAGVVALGVGTATVASRETEPVRRVSVAEASSGHVSKDMPAVEEVAAAEVSVGAALVETRGVSSAGSPAGGRGVATKASSGETRGVGSAASEEAAGSARGGGAAASEEAVGSARGGGAAASEEAAGSARGGGAAASEEAAGESRGVAPADGLLAESRGVAEAEAALGRGEFVVAIERVRALARSHPAGQLRLEREAVELCARCGLREAGAGALAEAFLRAHADAAVAGKVRARCAEALAEKF